ncbi:hypothetical protein CRG98_043921 [Punica granatum]|uniref:Uncharacterized protein n=1 Tax=Punica granatum TaxID=22663 RepID=A0A2I0HVW3_PUNGR|nr:hypothetical protein CRG98_043921 [Punica granatum]
MRTHCHLVFSFVKIKNIAFPGHLLVVTHLGLLLTATSPPAPPPIDTCRPTQPVHNYQSTAAPIDYCRQIHRWWPNCLPKTEAESPLSNTGNKMGYSSLRVNTPLAELREAGLDFKPLERNSHGLHRELPRDGCGGIAHVPSPIPSSPIRRQQRMCCIMQSQYTDRVGNCDGCQEALWHRGSSSFSSLRATSSMELFENLANVLFEMFDPSGMQGTRSIISSVVDRNG